MKIFALALVILLSACVSGPTYQWVKDGGTPEQLQAEMFDCDYKSRNMTRERNEILWAIQVDAFFKQCMRSKGYQLEKIK